MKELRKLKLGDWLNMAYPLLIGIISILCTIYFKFDYKVKGMKDVLTSVITFTSIVIAFYTSMYGILITIKDSKIMREIKKHHVNGIFKYQLYESLFFSFLILILSIILQISINYSGKTEKWLFYIWMFSIGYFIGSTYRIISLLLRIIFVDDSKKNSGYKEKSNEQRREQYNEINNGNDRFINQLQNKK